MFITVLLLFFSANATTQVSLDIKTNINTENKENVDLNCLNKSTNTDDHEHEEYQYLKLIKNIIDKGRKKSIHF